MENCDLILDGADNFETRYLLNDISVKSGVPWIYGAALGSYGITAPLVPGRGPCFACLYPEPPPGIQPTCDVDGILASTTTCIGALQVASALRLITGWPDFQTRIQTIDVWSGAARSIVAPEPDPECFTCARREFRHLDGRRKVPVSLCGRNAVQLHESARPLDLRSLAERLRSVGSVRVNEFALRVNLPKYDVTVFPDGRAIVKGTTDIGVARGIYAQLIGA